MVIGIRERILKVFFQFINISAIIKVSNFVRFKFDNLGVIGKGLIVILEFHFHRRALFVHAHVLRSQFNSFAVIVDGILKLLVSRIGIAALLINSGELICVFVVEIGGFAKQFDGFVPLLVLGSLCPFSGKLVCFFRVLGGFCAG